MVLVETMAKDDKHGLSFISVSESNFDEYVDDVTQLHSEWQGERFAPAYWRWRYLDSPLEGGGLALAIRDGRVIGKYGSVLLPMVVDGKQVIGALGEGLFIHPQERSWRTYMGLLRATGATIEGGTVSVGFGISTPMAAGPGERFGAVNFGPAPAYARALVPEIFLRRVQVATMGGPDIRPVTSFDASFDELWRNLACTRTVSLVKDAAYLNWRYVKQPDFVYSHLAAYKAGRLAGLLVLSVVDERQRGRIFELMAIDEDQDVLQALLLRAGWEMAHRGVRTIVASFRPGSAEAGLLEGMAFRIQPPGYWNVELTASVRPDSEATAALELRNWNFSLGDWLLG